MEGEEKIQFPNIEQYDTAESILQRLEVVANAIKSTPPKKRDLCSSQRYKALTMETMLLTTKLYLCHPTNTQSQKRRLSKSKQRGEESKILLQELSGLTAGNSKIKRFVEEYKYPS